MNRSVHQTSDIVDKPLDYAFAFQFEREFDYLRYQKWLGEHFYVSPLSIVMYLISIYLGQRWMKKRTPCKLQGPLVLWNLLLTLFSMAGTLRVVPWLYSSLREDPYLLSTCREAKYPSPVAFWVAAFTISKVVELGDTFFVVARKHEVIFLHWFHHISVLAFVWYANSQPFSIAPFLAAINYSIHSLMYSYYCVKAINLPVLTFVPLTITFLQTAQMVAGFALSLHTYSVADSTIASGKICETPMKAIYLCLAMYASYFLLFLRLFINRYVRKSNGKRSRDDFITTSTERAQDSLKSE